MECLARHLGGDRGQERGDFLEKGASAVVSLPPLQATTALVGSAEASPQRGDMHAGQKASIAPPGWPQRPEVAASP